LARTVTPPGALTVELPLMCASVVLVIQLRPIDPAPANDVCAPSALARPSTTLTSSGLFWASTRRVLPVPVVATVEASM